MLFSVIVPVYNIEAYLPRCVDSILSNSFQDYELILVDDGSTDRCAGICDAYAAKDERISAIHKPNGGLVSARNAGICHARGAYILYVDGDDWVSPDWMSTVEAVIAKAPAQPDVVAFGFEKVYSDHVRTHLPNLAEGFYDRKMLEQQVFPRIVIDRRLDYGDAIIFQSSWNKAYKKELLQAHHCMDEGIRLSEDNAFVFECCLCANSIAVCHDVLYHYNKLNPTSIRSKTDLERYKKILRTFQYIEKRLKEFAPLVKGQMDDYYASRIILEVFDTNSKIPELLPAARHIARELKATRLLDFVHIRKLPFHARVYMLLLKLHCYLSVCIATRLITWIKDRKRLIRG